MSVVRVVQSVLCTWVFLSVGVAPAICAWPLSEAAPTVCGYGATYADAAGASVTHTGVDLAADGGSNVLAVQAGHVTFAGRVPAAGGGSVLAVTVETAEGEKWTYLPFAALAVQSGRSVECGDSLGSLSPSGDRSSPVSHLHVSLRRGECYLDPTPLLSFVGAAPDSSPDRGEKQVSSVPAPATYTAVSGDCMPGAVASPASIPSPVVLPGPVSGISAQPEPSPLQPVIPASNEVRAGSAVARIGEAGRSRTRLARVNACEPARRSGEAHVSEPEASGPKPGSADRPPVPNPVLGLGLGMLLLPATWLTISRSLSSRVTAPGDTVAAAVGR